MTKSKSEEAWINWVRESEEAWINWVRENGVAPNRIGTSRDAWQAATKAMLKYAREKCFEAHRGMKPNEDGELVDIYCAMVDVEDLESYVNGEVGE